MVSVLWTMTQKTNSDSIVVECKMKILSIKTRCILIRAIIYGFKLLVHVKACSVFCGLQLISG